MAPGLKVLSLVQNKQLKTMRSIKLGIKQLGTFFLLTGLMVSVLKVLNLVQNKQHGTKQPETR